MSWVWEDTEHLVRKVTMVQGLGWGTVDIWHCLHLPPAEDLLHPVEIVSIFSAEVRTFRLENAWVFTTIEADFQQGVKMNIDLYA